MACSRTVLFYCLLLLACVWPMDKAKAEQLVLKDLVLDNVAGNIQLGYGITVQDAQELYSYLDDGLVLEMECTAKLIRNRRWWRDSVLQEQTLVFELKNQLLQGEYSLKKEGSQNVQKDQDLAELLQEQWSEIRIDLGDWSQLEPDNDYSVELSVHLKRSNVPLWLKRSLFFWSWDVMPEQNYRMDFSY